MRKKALRRGMSGGLQTERRGQQSSEKVRTERIGGKQGKAPAVSSGLVEGQGSARSGERRKKKKRKFKGESEGHSILSGISANRERLHGQGPS